MTFAPRATRQPVSRRTALSVAGISLALLVLGAPASAGKVRRTSSKGVVYALDFATEGDKPVSLLIHPGANAWLRAAWGPQSHGVTRMGRGLKWSYLADTRRGATRGDLYLEAEPLGGKTFKVVSAAYKKRLTVLWRHAGKSIVGKVKGKKGKPLRLGKRRVPTFHYKMSVRRVSDGATAPALTILFPFADHLVALTAMGAPDQATKALRGLKLSSPAADNKPRVFHCVDTVDQSTTYFVLTPPMGYRLQPVVPAEADRTLVARWKRSAEGGATETITLTRLSLDIDKTAQEGVERWASLFEARGEGRADTLPVLSVDGDSCPAVSWRLEKKDAEPTGWGWLVGWMSGTTLYALKGETDSHEGAKASAAEVARVPETMLTWLVR